MPAIPPQTAGSLSHANEESMGWGSRIGIGVAVLVLVSAIGLVIYGGRVQPHTHTIDQVIPNDRLPS
jgi:hypothetical protein